MQNGDVIFGNNIDQIMIQVPNFGDYYQIKNVSHANKKGCIYHDGCGFGDIYLYCLPICDISMSFFYMSKP